LKSLVLARRYAKALFELAEERNSIESIARELETFQKLLAENTELRNFFLSPEAGKEQKVKFVQDNFKGQFSTLFINFLHLLIEKGRQNIIDEIVGEFGKRYDRYQNKVRASAITAIPMPEAEMQALSELLSKRFQANFEIENRVDPDILGGVVLQIDGKVLDGSIRNQLRRLRAQMLFERN